MDSASKDLKELLNDVNHFLSVTLRDEKLSENAVTEKESLLDKVAMQLSPPYLDMNSSKKSTEGVEDYVDADTAGKDQGEDCECYEEFPENHFRATSTQLEEEKISQAVDYENISLPFSKLRQEAKKIGCLCRKEKFLFMERLNRTWVGIIHDLLLIYSSQKETKPSSVIPLRNYDARSDPSYLPKHQKKDCCFEIVCPGKKTYQFIARTVKDKEQWIAAINDSSQRLSYLAEESESAPVPAKPAQSSSSTDTEEEYDDVRCHQPEYENEEIYHDISDLIPEVPPQKTQVSPLRRRPVPSIPQEDSSDLDSVYDDIDNVNPDNLYYNCVEKSGKPNVESQSNDSAPQICPPDIITGRKDEYTEEEDIYDDIGILDRLGTHKGTVNQEGISAPSRIHHIIQKMQATMGNVSKPNVNNVRDSNIPSEEFYEPIDMLEEVTSKTDTKPAVPPRTSAVRF